MNTQPFPKMCERGEPFARQLHNNNGVEGVLADGDANANAIQREDEGRTGGTSSRQQDRVTGWAPDSQCDDPELAEFEMLECQELEMYLVDDGEDYVGLSDRKDEVEQKAEREAAERPTLEGAAELSAEESRTEMHSEADVFLSCVSTMSTTDNVTDQPVRTQQADSATEGRIVAGPRAELAPSKSTIQQKFVDMNSNSTVGNDDCRKNNNQRTGAGGAVLELNPGRKGEQKAAARSSHQETGAEKNRRAQADETPVGHGSPHRASASGTQGSPESRAIRKQGSFDNALKKQNSFDRSFKKQPSFENSLKKQGSFENGTVTGLERRRPWGSPSRPATPSSPKMTSSSSSPMRRPSGSPARVQGPRALSSERSESPQRSLTAAAKLPAKAGSSIPKPVPPQQKESDSIGSSPPQKAKNIRPKIITYVRKTAQSRAMGADVQHEASSASPFKAPKDHKAAPQLKSTAVPCSSDCLWDKHRQEMQKTDGHLPGTAVAGMKPSGSGAPQRLGPKSGSFHEDVPEKCLQGVRKSFFLFI